MCTALTFIINACAKAKAIVLSDEPLRYGLGVSIYILQRLHKQY